jgi:hypothetical protein
MQQAAPRARCQQEKLTSDTANGVAGNTSTCERNKRCSVQLHA